MKILSTIFTKIKIASQISTLSIDEVHYGTQGIVKGEGFIQKSVDVVPKQLEKLAKNAFT